jgi:hypothetical protein
MQHRRSGPSATDGRPDARADAAAFHAGMTDRADAVPAAPASTLADALSQGSTFVVRLPRAPRPAA